MSPDDVAVIGAGAVGATAAYDLASRGVRVTLFERGEIASGSTGRAAGVLYGAFAEDRDAAIGRRSIERFRELSGEGDFRFLETPYVWLAREGDRARMEAIETQVRRMQVHGVDAELLDGESLAAFAPALRTDDVGVAAVARDTGRTDPASYARLLARKAEREGATVHTGREVSIATGDGETLVIADGKRRRFDAVVVTAGVHTKRLLADAGHRIAMKPYRVQALTAAASALRRDESESATAGDEPPMVYDATAGFYLRPHPDGLLLGDGTEAVESDPDDWERGADSSFVESVLDRAGERLALDDLAVEEAWAGLCSATPDRNPLLGWVDEDRGLYVATGWQGHGFMRAPALGERIAGELCGESGIDAFDPTRFTGEEEFEIVEGMAVE
jgi:sarcosine oxidase, subunit beta